MVKIKDFDVGDKVVIKCDSFNVSGQIDRVLKHSLIVKLTAESSEKIGSIELTLSDFDSSDAFVGHIFELSDDVYKSELFDKNEAYDMYADYCDDENYGIY
jgi:hypothetical protein